MAAFDYETLTKAHQEQEAKGKRVRPCDLTVEPTPAEAEELAKLTLHDKATRYRAILAERGVPK